MARARALAGVAVVTASLTLVVRTSCAQSQVTGEVALAASRVILSGYLPSTMATASTFFSGRVSNGEIHIGGDVSRFETGHTTAYGTAGATLRLFGFPSLRGFLYADGGKGAFRGSKTSQYGRAAIRLESSRLWGAFSAGQAEDVQSYQTRRAEIGASIISQSAFALSATTDLVRVRSLWYGNTRMRASAQSNRFSFQGNAGRRNGEAFGGVKWWANMVGTVELQERFHLSAAIGVDPSDPERSNLGSHYSSIGLRIALGRRGVLYSRTPTPPARVQLEAESVLQIGAEQPDGSRVIVLQLDGAERVELMGDFTDWEPRDMMRLDNGSWMFRAVLAPGSHRLNIRTDGGDWKVPKGIPALPDDFGGTAGVIAVE